MLHHLVFTVLFLLGLYTVIYKNNLIKMVIGLNIMEIAVFFWVIAVSDTGKSVPIYHLNKFAASFNDPVPQALTLTGIIIGASTTALLLTFIIELNKFADTIDSNKLEGLNE